MTDCDQQRGEALHHATSLALHGFIPPDEVLNTAAKYLAFLKGDDPKTQVAFGGAVVRAFPRWESVSHTDGDPEVGGVYSFNEAESHFDVVRPVGTVLDGVLSMDGESPTTESPQPVTLPMPADQGAAYRDLLAERAETVKRNDDAHQHARAQDVGTMWDGGSLS